MDPEKTFYLKNPPGFLAFETSSWILTSNMFFWLEPTYWDILSQSAILTKEDCFEIIFVPAQGQSRRRHHRNCWYDRTICWVFYSLAGGPVITDLISLCSWKFVCYILCDNSSNSDNSSTENSIDMQETTLSANQPLGAQRNRKEQRRNRCSWSETEEPQETETCEDNDDQKRKVEATIVAPLVDLEPLQIRTFLATVSWYWTEVKIMLANTL